MRPTKVTIRVGVLLVGLGAAAGLEPLVLPLWLAGVALVVLVLVLDAARGRGEGPLVVERELISSLSIDMWTSVALTVENTTPRPQRVEVFDGVPPEAEHEQLPRHLEIAPGQTLRFTYRFRPLERGDLTIGRTELLVTSPLGLWARRVFAGEESVVRVYPNFAAVTGLSLAAFENRLASMGIRTRQRRGMGLDFHQLRDYQLGDSLRQIDWKATSRKRRAISREYQEERDQQLVFLVDCGRRMRSEAKGLSHFDHCLNAMLLVSYIALRQGDAVGVVTFSGEDRWLPPRKGAGTLHHLLRGLYDLKTTLEPSDYAEAASRLRKLQPRRSLVILLTNQRDEDESDLAAGLALLRKRHLVLLASLREEAVEERLARPVETFEHALTACATRAFVDARAASLERLSGSGSMTLDVRPERLAVALAERYLDIKRAGRL